MPSVIESLKAGLRHHQAGQLAQAETLYRQALRIDPAQPHGLHLLGVVCHQRGNSEAAVEYLNKAIPSSAPTAEIYHNRALAYFALGKIDEAMADCRRALEIDPDYTTAQNNLAHALNEKDEFQEAEQWCRKALKLDPQRAGAHLNLGRALKGQGKLDEALACYQRSLELDPHCAEAHNNLGNLHRENGQLDEAVAAYQQALKIEPEHLRALRSLGSVFYTQDKFSEAESAFRKALALDLESAGAHADLGMPLNRQGKLDEAVACYERALEIEPDHVRGLKSLGCVLHRQQKFTQAESAYRKALAVEPDDVESHVFLGLALERQDRADEALACFRRALEIKPDCAAAMAGLAAFYEQTNDLETAEHYAAEGLKLAPTHPRLNMIAAKCEKRQGRFQEAVDRLEEVRSRDQGEDAHENSLANSTRASILFQLGEIHDRCGRTDEAFAVYQEGNRLESREADILGLDKRAVLEVVAQARGVFQPALVGSWTPAPPLEDERAPVFMTGFPRSGTTLLDQILDSHPAIQTLEEKPSVASVNKVIATYGTAPLWALCNLMPEHFAELRGTYFRTVERYIERRPELLLVDRNPFLTRDIGLVHRIFPTARFILVVRHPCDVCLSCFMQPFQLHPGTVHFFTLEDAARLYAETMGLWQHFLGVLPLEYHVMRYEDLLDDFEHQTRRLLDFLGVGWDESVRRYTEHARTRRVRTASYHQVVEPLYRRSRYRWRRYAKHLAPVMDVLRPYIEYFGYDVED